MPEGWLMTYNSHMGTQLTHTSQMMHDRQSGDAAFWLILDLVVFTVKLNVKA